MLRVGQITVWEMVFGGAHHLEDSGLPIKNVNIVFRVGWVAVVRDDESECVA